MVETQRDPKLLFPDKSLERVAHSVKCLMSADVDSGISKTWPESLKMQFIPKSLSQVIGKFTGVVLLFLPDFFILN